MSRSGVLIRLSLKQLFWQMAGTFGGGRRYSLGLIFLAAATILGLSGFYSYMLITGVPAAMSFLIPFTMNLAGFGLILVFGFYHAQGYLFDFRDFDLLYSMPLTRRQILSSKLTAMAVMMLIYSVMLIIPMIVLYGIHFQMPVSFYLIGLVGLLCLPAVPMTAACLIAVAVRFFSRGMKHAVLIRNVLSIGMVLLILFGSLSLQSLMGQVSDLTGMLTIIETWLPPVYWMSMAMLQGNWTYLFMLIGVSAAALGIFILLLSPLWMKLNQAGRQSTAVSGGKLALRSSSLNRTLLKKEIRRYFASTALVMNTLIGPLLIVLYTAMAIFQKDTLMLMLGESGLNVSGLGSPIAMMTLAVCLFCIMMCPTTATSISLEGKNFWIVRSLPIPAQDYFNAKIRLNLLLTIPAAWLCILILAAVYQFSIFYLLICLLTSLAASLFCSYFGLAVNLKFPRFDYDREIVVVKQSLSTMITVFSGMLMTFTLSAGAIFLTFIPTEIYLCLVILLLLTASFLIKLCLDRQGEKILSRL